MYKSELHELLLKVIKNTMWVSSSKEEDNYRQILCSTVYKEVRPENVFIPSTKSGDGDIQINKRIIEIKYASDAKTVYHTELFNDFDSILAGFANFLILTIKIDSISERHIHPKISLPMLTKNPANNLFEYTGKYSQKTYKGTSILLPACYPHDLHIIKKNPKKDLTGYLSFEHNHSIDRTSVLQVDDKFVHVDIIGSIEDGVITYLYTAIAEEVTDVPGVATHSIECPNPNGQAFHLAALKKVDIKSRSQKNNGTTPPEYFPNRIISNSINCYNIG